MESPVKHIIITISTLVLTIAITVCIIISIKQVKDDEVIYIPEKIETLKPEETQPITTMVPETIPPETIPTETEPQAPVKEPTSPLGFYTEFKSVLIKKDTYSSRWPASDDDAQWRKDTWTVPGETHLISDITYFSLVPSADENVTIRRFDTDWLTMWKKYYSEEYRIGYQFDVVLKSGEIKHLTVKQTKDTMGLSDYFEVYLYDDVYHANDGAYSHTVQSEFEKRDTVYNSTVKITLRNKCYDIDHIDMTGFVYSGESDFDASGAYIGVDKVTCTVAPEK